VSEKALKALLVTLGVVVVLWLAVTLLPGRGGSAGAPGKMAAFFEGISPDAVTAVTIEGPGTHIELRREATGWSVNGYAADSSAVARFWTSVDSADLGDLVARNPANHARMGVAADSTHKVTFTLAGGDTRVLLVGKSGPRYPTVYVRLPDDDNVYLLDSDLRASVAKVLPDWRDKRIVAVDTARVRRLSIWLPGGGYEVVRSDSVWNVAGGGEADASTVRSMLGELRDLRGTGFVEVTDTLGPAGRRIVALNEAGDTLARLELGKGKGDVWVRTRGKDTVFRLPGWRVERLVPEKKKVAGGS